MNFSILFAIFFIFGIASAQWNQWTPQQLEAYRQQYYQWYLSQQRAQPIQQPVQQQAATAPQGTPHPVWGHAETDVKGNVWHGNDNAKISIISRTSWP